MKRRSENIREYGTAGLVMIVGLCCSSSFECCEPSTGGLGFFAGRIETDYLFIQPLRVRHVHLALFELGGLEQVLSLVTRTTHKQNTAESPKHESCGHRRCPFRALSTAGS